MTLLDLTKELFTYLVLFREQAAEANPPTPERVAEDLDAIFSRMEDQAQANPALGPGYEQVRYCLAALCDEVALCGDWPGKAQWSQHTWEERLFGTREGSQRFFIFMDRLDSLPKDVLAVHYLCLTLGFCGCYAPGDPRLAQIKSQVLSRLPGVAPPPSNAAACPAQPAPVVAPAPDPHPEPPAPEAAPKVDPPPAAEEPPAPAAAAPRPERKPRDLRYLAAGGLAVLAFAFTLGLGIVALHDSLFGPDAGEKPAGREVDLTLPEPLAPLVVLNLPRTSATSASSASSATTVSTASSATTATTAATTQTSATTATTAAPTSATAVTSATTATTQPPAPAPAPAPIRAAQPAPAQAATQAEPETYSLHAGLFVGPIQSGRLAEQLAAAGFAAWVREERRADGQVRYRVYVGPFADKNQAQEVLAAITAKFGIKPFVVTSPAP